MRPSPDQRGRREGPVGAVRAFLRRPSVHLDLAQVLRSVAAGTLAWVLAAGPLGLASPYLAPWTALLTIHATVYRSVRRGAQSVAATVLGILLAFGTSHAVGGLLVPLALSLLMGLLVARLPRLGSEGVGVASTALFVLTGGMAEDVGLLTERLAATGVGVVVALAMNVLLVPPITDRGADEAVADVTRRLGGLLEQMAGELCEPDLAPDLPQQWMRRTREIDARLADTRGWARQATESHWWNPRGRWLHRLRSPDDVEDAVQRLEVAVSSTRGIARTVRRCSDGSHVWSPDFRDGFVHLLGRVGRHVADPAADVGEVGPDLDALVRATGRAGLHDPLWPCYGRLLSDLGDVVETVDESV